MSDADKLRHSDEPRQHYSEDALGYAEFASRLAKTVQNIPCKRGITIGLYGAWGTGKTSIINFVRSYLSELPPAEQPIIVEFNPWWFSGEEEMASRFFETLLNDLREEHFSESAIAAMKDIAELMAEAPIGWSWLAKVSSKAIGRLRERNLSTLRSRAAMELRKQRKRILVVIDDVDRLFPDEMLTVFKLTKVIGDLPNIVCLLCMDKTAVVRSIGHRFTTILPDGNISGDFDSGKVSARITFRDSTEAAEDFLEKIVQVPFDLPTPDPDAIGLLLLKALDEILSVSDADIDQNYFRDLYFDGLAVFFDTPRKLLRLRNSVTATFAAVHGEVHPADFIALETLRIMCPDAYRVLRENGDYFWGPAKFEKYDKINYEQARAFHQAWLSEIEPEAKAPVEHLIRVLFPKVEKALGGSLRVSGSLPATRRKLLARMEDKYPIYFGYVVPERDFPHTEMEALIKADAKALEDRLLYLTTTKRPNQSTRLVAFFEKFDDYLPDLDRDQLRKFVEVLLRIGDRLIVNEDHGKGILGLPMGNQQRLCGLLQRLLYQLSLRNAKTQTGATATELLLEVLPTSSIGVSVYLVFSISRSAKQTTTTAQRGIVVPESELTKVQQVLIQKLRQTSGTDILINPITGIILDAWSDWDRSGLKDWGSQHVRSDDDILKLLGQLAASSIPYAQLIENMFGLSELSKHLDSMKNKDRSEWVAARKYLNDCLSNDPFKDDLKELLNKIHE